MNKWLKVILIGVLWTSAGLGLADTVIDTNFGTSSVPIPSNPMVSGVVPTGWQENSSSWANLHATCEVQSDGGEQFLRVSVQDLTLGEMRLCKLNVPTLAANTFYRLTLRARSPRESTLQFGLRHRYSPSTFLWNVRKPLKTEWQDIRHDFYTSEPLGEIGFWFYLYSAGDVVDLSSLKLERLPESQLISERTAANLEGGPVNVLHNTRFPLGLPAGWSIYNKFSDGDEVTVATDSQTTGPSGFPALKISTSDAYKLLSPLPPIVGSAPISIVSPMQHVFRMMIKSSGESSWKFSIVSGMWNGVVSQTITPGTGWQELELPFEPGLCEKVFSIRITKNTEGEGTLWLDSLYCGPGIVLDNTSTGVTPIGTWTSSMGAPGYYGIDYVYNWSKGPSIEFAPQIPATGNYSVYIRHTAASNRATNVPVNVVYASGTATVSVDQTIDNGVWVPLGTYNFDAGTSGKVIVNTTGTDGVVIADAVKFCPEQYVQPMSGEVALACQDGDAAVGNIQFDDETFDGGSKTTEVRYAATGNLTGATLKARIVNAYGEEEVVTLAASLGSELIRTGSLDYNVFPLHPYGSFRVEVWAENASEERITPINEIVMHRMRRPIYWGQDAPNSPFGIHVLPTNRLLTMMKAVGVNWARLHDSGVECVAWYDLDPGDESQWIIMDNTSAEAVQTPADSWTSSSSAPGYYGNNYLVQWSKGPSITFTPQIPVTGPYSVYIRHTADENRANNVPVRIDFASSFDIKTIDQTKDNGVWLLLGTYNFNEGSTGKVTINTVGSESGKVVIADAVMFCPAEFFGDEKINRYRNHHMKLFAELGTAPEWASYLQYENPHDPMQDRYYQPLNLSDYENYVNAIVSRYKDDIDAYFVWNEPWNHHYWAVDYDENKTGLAGYVTSLYPMVDFAALQEVAYKMVKKVAEDLNHDIKVSGFNTCNGLGGGWNEAGDVWTEGVMDEGGVETCDMVGYHQYSKMLNGYPGDDVDNGFNIAWGAVLDEYSGAIPRPVWLSEGSGTYCLHWEGMYKNILPWENTENVWLTSDYLCRYTIRLLTMGVEKVFHYSAHAYQFLGNSGGHAVMVAQDGSLHPSAVAHSAMAYFLEDKEFQTQTDLGNGLYAYTFSGSSGDSVTVLMDNYSSNTWHIPRPTGGMVYDLFGNQMNDGTRYAGNIVYLTGTAANQSNAVSALAMQNGADIILDNSWESPDVTRIGTWGSSTTAPGFYGNDYGYCWSIGPSVEYAPSLPATGSYSVYIRFTAGSNRANNVKVDVVNANGTDTVTVNQSDMDNNNVWVLLGTYSFNAGSNGKVIIKTVDHESSKVVIADAVKFSPQ